MRAVKAWINHFALNTGAGIACVWYAIVPPQWTGHTQADISSLAGSNPFKSFIEGLRG